MKKQKTKELLLEKGSELMLRKGFNNTGIQEIVDACRVPKGSFYFYFESKEMFGIELINKIAEELNSTLDKFLADRSLSPGEKLSAFFDSTFENLGRNDFKGGSLIGKLAAELSDASEMFRQALSLVYEHLSGKIALTIGDSGNKSEMTAEELARFLIFTWESALLQSKLFKSNQPARNFKYILETLTDC
ncbi:MAG: hypothetical protein A2W91_17575 [Bacteroidetes bacterium GWF2_38_335]|nr:MAG: hypothetical protein A2W91_17575 [Bacteroidetes bacterium GWF2_38_335]OFY78056.1 MAG: hypothetical protein A2281_18885 [Bacteroidetes bacterium RIFOXYA12_FULL_38_20]HBS88328.1 TetR family transcriptional regulator [Bacteroidales bacterium]